MPVVSAGPPEALEPFRQGRLPSGSTRVAAVIGDPVRHSLSPVLHNNAFAARGLDLALGARRFAGPVPGKP